MSALGNAATLAVPVMERVETVPVDIDEEVLRRLNMARLMLNKETDEEKIGEIVRRIVASLEMLPAHFALPWLADLAESNRTAHHLLFAMNDLHLPVTARRFGYLEQLAIIDELFSPDRMTRLTATIERLRQNAVGGR